MALACDSAEPIGAAPTAGPRLRTSPEKLDFGTVRVGEGDTQDLVVTNNGQSTVTITIVAVEGAGRAAYKARPDETIKIAGGRSVRLTVTFEPPAPGPALAELVLFHDVPGHDPTRVALIGAGEACVDLDTDGFGVGCAPGPDCDDNDPERHPGKREVCDGKDNDCNSAVDDGLTTTTYHRDADGDGYGAARGAPLMACAPPTGYVARGGDCDDNEDRRFPTNPEVCDGLDNDCNDMIDDGARPTTYYEDRDRDGFGNDMVSMLTCNPPMGWVTRGGDCDDGEGRSFPGNPEVCTGGIDEDCDRLVDGADPDCNVPDPVCVRHDDCGLNMNRSACPLLGVANERCAPVCRAKAECAAGHACRPLPGSASLGFCQASPGAVPLGGACNLSSECDDGLCVQNACRKVCQTQTQCGTGEICGITVYNTNELGGRDARRLSTVCRPVGSRQPIGGSCNIDAANVDTGLCAAEHCDLPPWSAQATTVAQCAPLCAGTGDCGANQVCGLVYNGLAETPNLPSTGEGAGRYYEAVLGCYTPYFRQNPITWQYNPPGRGALGSACDPVQSTGRLACRSHLCAQFPPIRGQCTDFCTRDADCLTPSTSTWRCRFGELSLTGIFLQSYDVADITKFVLVGVCAP